MNAEKFYPMTPSSEAETGRIRELAATLGVTFDEIVRSGAQGTTVGIQSRSVLFSRRLDSRTYFVHDVRYGIKGELGVLETTDEDYLRTAHQVAARLEIPASEIAAGSVIKTQTQTASYDLETREARFEGIRPGRHYAHMTRQIEGLPVWSSRVLVGLTSKRQIGFLEAHWPEIPRAAVQEAHALDELTRSGWRPPEQRGAKVESVEAGIIHSPAAGFLMDIYPAIRVIYTPERGGKKPVLYLDRHGKPVPTPRAFDLPPEELPPPRKPAEVEVDTRRTRFRELLLANPKALEPVKMNTSYEELACVGYQPQFGKLEGVVYIKRHSGYGGGLCSPGTQEYVRFYLSLDNGATWHDEGLTSFTAWDLPFSGERLEYAVTLQIKVREFLCPRENLPLVRAILSWNHQPPANTPDHHPYWGNVKQARIQIGAVQLLNWKQFLSEAEMKLPAALETLVDLEQPVKLQSKHLGPVDLIEAYKEKAVPEHRLLTAEIVKWTGNPAISLADIGIDWGTVVPQLLETQGDTQYEQLNCVGLNPNDEQLIGVIHVKLPYGYSGGLCTAGSQEYVAFWIDYGAGWTYAGTTSVNVHDITRLNLHQGLDYAVFLPVDFTGHRMPCKEGPVTARVRATLSWNVPPPSHNPEYIPYWGNRLETLIHIKPGPKLGVHEPFLSSVGDVPESQVNAAGKANGQTLHTHLALVDSPFGGWITIAGHIANPAPGLQYRVMKKPNGAPDTSYAPLLTPIGLTINTWNPVTGWAQSQITLTPDPATGYCSFQDYSWDHSVEGSLMGGWYSTVGDDGKIFDLRIDVSTDGDPAHDLHSNVVTVSIDNKAPEVSLTIDLGTGVQCAEFTMDPSLTINGAFAATDLHFREFYFEIQPSGPPNDPPHGVLPVPASGVSLFYAGTIADPGVAAGTYTLKPAGNAGPPKTGPMDACGYALILWANDRTNVNSGGGYNWSKASVGFCLRAPAV